MTVISGEGANNTQLIRFEGLRALPQGKKLIVSSELQECYYIDNKTVIPCNHLMHGDFPEVYKGEFEIKGANIDLSVPVPFEVYPRWRVM